MFCYRRLENEVFLEGSKVKKFLSIALVFGVVVGCVANSGCKEKTTDTTYEDSVQEQPASAKQPASKDVTASVTVYITRTGECYHRGNCSYLRQSKIPKDLKYAKKHYRACSRCRPPK
ncbi:hypothetical protein LCGC14_2765150 [marine sediment metagenome]|uniref:Ada DNA repair metal-binding domain-containing protein n=1 Tax=marine sediment metagenome TaxID=412755 RepID=A0A0F8ZJM6_9ZZZZ